MWQLREWWLPKEGNAPSEYEDAFRSAPERGRFAAADGATETSFSGRWAAALVATFVTAPPGFEADVDALASWLAPLQEAWSEAVPWDRLPWYALEKAQAGAFASLLGLELFPRPEGGAHWRASAVGDSELFHVRDGVLLRAWPVASAEEFGSRPRLLSSLPGQNRVALAEWARLSGEAEPTGRPPGPLPAEPGDRFYLTTDALAHWALSAAEAGEPAWETLWEIADEESFAALVSREREAHRLRNDDVTLVAFTVPAAWERIEEEFPTGTETLATPEPADDSASTALMSLQKALPASTASTADDRPPIARAGSRSRRSGDGRRRRSAPRA
jgi:hypothetical protein